jgi:hypothetical protein
MAISELDLSSAPDGHEADVIPLFPEADPSANAERPSPAEVRMLPGVKFLPIRRLELTAGVSAPTAQESAMATFPTNPYEVIKDAWQELAADDLGQL